MPSTPRKPRKKTRRAGSGVRGLGWWVAGLCLVFLVGAVGALKWARTERGRAALLTLGSQKMYSEVQTAVDAALSDVLPGYAAGSVGQLDPGEERPTGGGREPSPAEAAYDWPASDQGPGAAIRCRVVELGENVPFWEIQRRIAVAIEPVGARILWGERIADTGRRGGRPLPDERSDLLRLDLGVTGRPTHTLVLRRPGAEGRLSWTRRAGDSAWNLLREQGTGPVVALIIDDWGNSRNTATEGILDLPVPITLSVLPGLRYSRHFSLQQTDLVLPPDRVTKSRVPDGPLAARARRLAAGCPVEVSLGSLRGSLSGKRREVMLHLPMQPMGYPGTNPGPNALMVGMRKDAIAALVDAALGKLPNVTGLNNHMGSAATGDARTMHELMQVLAERDLFFVDSLTTSRSVAYDEARKAGLPALKNRIFLDYEHEDADRIAANLAALVRSARSTGFAVGIGHPHRQTAEVLARELPRLQKEGVRFVTISEMLALREGS